MRTPEPLLTFQDLAQRLGVSVQRLYRQHRELREQHGFPPPVAGMGRLWDPRAIENWLASQRGEAVPIGTLLPPEPPELEAVVIDWKTELDRRAAAMGG